VFERLLESWMPSADWRTAAKQRLGLAIEVVLKLHRKERTARLINSS